MIRDFIARPTLIAGALALFLFSPFAVAAQPSPPPPAALPAEDAALVDRATAYLQDLGEVKGRFEQTDARGDVSQGVLYIKRPGRARFVYDPPSGLVVISNGDNVLVTDSRLKTANRYPLRDTPLALILAKVVRLDKGVTVTAVDRSPGGFSLSLRVTRHLAQGQISLVFLDNPLRLVEWRLTDAHGRTTQIRLTSLEPSLGLDPALFVVPPRRPATGQDVQP